SRRSRARLIGRRLRHKADRLGPSKRSERDLASWTLGGSRSLCSADSTPDGTGGEPKMARGDWAVGGEGVCFFALRSRHFGAGSAARPPLSGWELAGRILGARRRASA